MAAQRMSPPSDTESNARKRVCKACDRCRLKKSKCDGASPCSRCRSDNAICVFGERKKSHDKIYPKGYVEMLEQQQTQLVNGLQEMYRRITNNEGWKGEHLDTAPNGYPLTHDILERLDALRIDGHFIPDRFEEDTELLRKRLFDGALHIKRQSSSDSDSEEEEVPLKRHAPSSKRSLTDPFLPTAGHFPPTPPTQTPPAFITASPTTYAATDSILDSSQLQMPHQLWSYPSTTYEPALDVFDTSPPSLYYSNRHMQQQPNPCLPMPSWGEDEFGNLAFNNFDIRLKAKTHPSLR